ncbi:unnamed protein product [Jaminaea pallidilutea]
MHSLYTLVCLVSVAIVASLSTQVAAGAIREPHRELLTRRFDPLNPFYGTNTDYPIPSQDPFYEVPSNVSSYSPGGIIRVRKVPTTIFGPETKSAYQLLYRTNSQGQPDATVATVIAPNNVASGKPKIVAVAPPSNAGSIDCAPSYVYIPGSKSNNTLEVVGLLTPSIAVHQGWYAVIPDFEGPQAKWLVGEVEGPALLDSIRAIMNHKDTIPDATGAMSVLNGYSGGGHTSAWGAQLASTYAPDLNIVGAVAGGLPANLQKTFDYLDGTSAAGLLLTAVSGVSKGYPDVKSEVNSRLKPGNWTDAYKLSSTGDLCATIAYKYGAINVTQGFTLDDQGRSIEYSSAVQNAFDQENLGAHQPPITKIPLYIAHSRADELIEYQQARDWADSQCSQGATLEFDSLSSGVHILTGILAQPTFTRQMQGFFYNAENNVKLSGSCKFNEVQGGQYPPFNDVLSGLLGPTAYALIQKVKNSGRDQRISRRSWQA